MRFIVAKRLGLNEKTTWLTHRITRYVIFKESKSFKMNSLKRVDGSTVRPQGPVGFILNNKTTVITLHLSCFKTLMFSCEIL